MIHRTHYRYLNSYLTFHFEYEPRLLKNVQMSGVKGGKQIKTENAELSQKLRLKE